MKQSSYESDIAVHLCGSPVCFMCVTAILPMKCAWTQILRHCSHCCSVCTPLLGLLLAQIVRADHDIYRDGRLGLASPCLWS